jgi:hypothetical protein
MYSFTTVPLTQATITSHVRVIEVERIWNEAALPNRNNPKFVWKDSAERRNAPFSTYSLPLLGFEPVTLRNTSQPFRPTSKFLYTVTSRCPARHTDLPQLTAWSWVLLEKPPVSQPLKNFRTLYENRGFIHKTPPLVPILSQTNPVHITHSYLYIKNNIIIPCVLHVLPISHPWLYYFKYIFRRVHVMKLLVVYSSPLLVHLFSVHICSSTPCSQATSVYDFFFFCYQRPSFTSIQNYSDYLNTITLPLIL